MFRIYAEKNDLWPSEEKNSKQTDSAQNEQRQKVKQREIVNQFILVLTFCDHSVTHE